MQSIPYTLYPISLICKILPHLLYHSFSINAYFLFFQLFDSRLHGSCHFTPWLKCFFFFLRTGRFSYIFIVLLLNSENWTLMRYFHVIYSPHSILSAVPIVFFIAPFFPGLGSCIAFRCHFYLILLNLEKFISFCLSWIIVKIQ